MFCRFTATEISGGHFQLDCRYCGLSAVSPTRELVANCTAAPDGPCVHRGDYLEEVRLGPKCHKRAGLYACDVHGKCTFTKKARGHACCKRCNDYEPYEEFDVKEYFSQVLVVSLQRRPERMKAFLEAIPADWPFAEPELFPAIDGRQCHPPDWWTQGRGAWGCYRSHQAIIEAALNRREQGNLLILEDDAIFQDDFADKAESFLENVPQDWHMLYLGGQHLGGRENRPERVSELVYRAHNVNRTHAYAVSPRGLLPLYRHLNNTKNWIPRHHVDHHYGRLHESRKINVYVPVAWMAGQGVEAGKSDISGRAPDRDRYWQTRCDTKSPSEGDQPFVAVVGPHASGTSCIAGLLWHMGVHLGDKLVGRWGSTPGKKCGYEAVGLRDICEAACRVPDTSIRLPRGKLYWRLHDWIAATMSVAKSKRAIAGGKYPFLCRMQDQLVNICDKNLVVVACDRPLEDAVESLAKRFPRIPKRKLHAHQKWLYEGKEDLCQRASKVVRVDFDALRKDPQPVIQKLANELGLSPTPEQLAGAVGSVEVKEDNEPAITSEAETVDAGGSEDRLGSTSASLCTAIVKTFQRPDTVRRLVHSLRTNLPGSPVIVADDGTPYADAEEPLEGVTEHLKLPHDSGISRGRNAALELVETPYLLLLDDDFVVQPDHEVLDAIALLEESDEYDILCFRQSRDSGKSWSSWASDFRHDSKRNTLHRIAAQQPITGIVQRVDMGLNAFVARTERIREVKWDDELKVGEHWDFFWRAKQAGLRVGIYTGIGLWHPGSSEGGLVYKNHRLRIKKFRALAVKKLGLKHYRG